MSMTSRTWWMRLPRASSLLRMNDMNLSNVVG
jgi:hypothetical protein